MNEPFEMTAIRRYQERKNKQLEKVFGVSTPIEQTGSDSDAGRGDAGRPPETALAPIAAATTASL